MCNYIKYRPRSYFVIYSTEIYGIRHSPDIRPDIIKHLATSPKITDHVLYLIEDLKLKKEGGRGRGGRGDLNIFIF